MRNKFIRNSFMAACASLALSNANAMDIDPSEIKGVQVAVKTAAASQMSLEENWTFKTDMRTRSYGDFELSTTITIQSLLQDTYIENIAVGIVNKTGDLLVRVLPVSPYRQSEDEKKMSLILKEDLKSSNISYRSVGVFGDFMISCVDRMKSEKFLSVFYNRGLIPDFVIDRIVKYSGIDNFTMNTERMIELINGQMTEESTVTDFKRIALEKLAIVKNPVRRAEITWGLVQEIKKSDNFDRQLIIDLCDQINSSGLPFFAEAKILQANLVFTDDSLGKVSVRERYQKPLIFLLKTSNIQEDKMNQNSLVKSFISHDVPSTEFPDHLKVLNNLTVSPESIFELLDIIRKQEIELKSLREKNNTVVS